MFCRKWRGGKMKETKDTVFLEGIELTKALYEEYQDKSAKDLIELKENLEDYRKDHDIEEDQKEDFEAKLKVIDHILAEREENLYITVLTPNRIKKEELVDRMVQVGYPEKEARDKIEGLIDKGYFEEDINSTLRKV